MITAKLEGVPELMAAFRGLKPSTQAAAMRRVMREAAAPIQETAERLVPISEDAPHIVDHIVIQTLTKVDDETFGGKRQLDDTEFAVAVGPARWAFYGWMQEYGTVHHGAKPFMRPAVDQEGAGAMKIIQSGLWAIVARLARRQR